MLNYRMKVRIQDGLVRFADNNKEIVGWTWERRKFPALVLKLWPKDEFLNGENKKSLKKLLKKI